MGSSGEATVGAPQGSRGGPLDALLPEHELRDVLKVSKATLYSWRRKGLPGYRVGVSYWYDESEVAEFIRTHLRRGGPMNLAHPEQT